MVPWYTLRMFSLITLGTAKINLLDALAASAVLLASPIIVRAILRGPRELLWVCAFVAYMAIPLAVGLHDPEAAFLAIRESRPLIFYTLAIVFAAGGYRVHDFRFFVGVYVAGTVAAIASVSAHVAWLTPLPGFRDVPATEAGKVWSGPYIQYLEWTVPLVAFLLSVAGALAASTRWTRLIWAMSSLVVVWYTLATGERSMQLLIVGIAVVLFSLPRFGGFRFHRLALIGLSLVVAGVFGVGALHGPAWINDPAKTTLSRWSSSLVDDSLRFRTLEVVNSLPRFAKHPVFGEGLGGIILTEDPLAGGPKILPGHPWRYIASGYGFLLVKTGLAGLLLYFAMVVGVAREAWRRISINGERQAWPVVTIGIAGIGALMALNLIHPTVDTPEGAIAFSLFYGMIMSQKTA
jgi:hypothetical protein